MKKLLGMIIPLLPLLASAKPACMPLLKTQQLVTSYYYDGNVPIKLRRLKRYKTNIAHLDILYYSAASLGIIYTGESYKLAELTRNNLIALHRWLKANKLHTKLMLSLGHWYPNNMRAVIFDATARAAFIQTLVQTLKDPQLGLSGIDIDWENIYSPARGEIAHFPRLIAAIDKGLQENGLTNRCISVDLPMSPFAKRYPKPKHWIKHVDWTNLMAYDFYGNPSHTELDGTLGYVTSPYAGRTPNYKPASIASTVSYYTSHDIPKRKMIIVLPFYTTIFNIHAANQKNNYGLRSISIDEKPPVDGTYRDLYREHGIFGRTKKGSQFHEYIFKSPLAANGRHAYWMTHRLPQSDELGPVYEFVSYEDPIAVKEIADYVVANHYLGLSSWQMTDDVIFKNKQSLQRVMVKVLKPLNHTATGEKVRAK